MEYIPFYTRFPELAVRETRYMTGMNSASLPDDEYSLIEMYCNRADCDCRRVMFSIYASNNPDKLLAVVNYGWESDQFYADWYGEHNLKAIRAMQGPNLNIGSPQSPLAPALLKLIKKVLKDEVYLTRIKEHYQMFKAATNNAQFNPKQRGKTGKRTRPLFTRKR